MGSRSSLYITIVVWEVLSNIFYFHPYLGKISILTNFFSEGLKPPTSCFFLGGSMWFYIFTPKNRRPLLKVSCTTTRRARHGKRCNEISFQSVKAKDVFPSRKKGPEANQLSCQMKALYIFFIFTRTHTHIYIYIYKTYLKVHDTVYANIKCTHLQIYNSYS